MLSTPAPTVSRATSPPDAGVVIAAQHPAMRRALSAVVEVTAGVTPIGATADLRHTMTLLHFAQPELVVVDMAMLGGPDVAGLATLKAAAPDAAMIVFGAGDHPSYASYARAAGAFDYVLIDDAAERLPEALLAAKKRLLRRASGSATLAR